MNDLTLTPELARFASEAVSAGRNRDIGDIVLAGISLLQRSEAEVAVFVASLDAAQAEGECDGFFGGGRCAARDERDARRTGARAR